MWQRRDSFMEMSNPAASAALWRPIQGIECQWELRWRRHIQESGSRGRRHSRWSSRQLSRRQWSSATPITLVAGPVRERGNTPSQGRWCWPPRSPQLRRLLGWNLRWLWWSQPHSPDTGVVANTGVGAAATTDHRRETCQFGAPTVERHTTWLESVRWEARRTWRVKRTCCFT